MFLASKIFEVKRKGIRNVVLTSNISFKNIEELGRVKHGCRSVMSIEAGTQGR